jgi:hypothetical protein
MNTARSAGPTKRQIISGPVSGTCARQDNADVLIDSPDLHTV